MLLINTFIIIMILCRVGVETELVASKDQLPKITKVLVQWNYSTKLSKKYSVNRGIVKLQNGAVRWCIYVR